MRVFVSLPVDADVRHALAAAVRAPVGEVHQLRPTPADQWHLTLAFLGAVDDDRVPEVVDAVTRATRTAGLVHGSLRLGLPALFGQAVAYGVVEDPSVWAAALSEVIQIEIEAAGLPVDRRPLRPHVTVARGRGRLRPPRALLERLPLVGGEWSPSTVVIQQSRLSPQGAQHAVVAEVRL